MLYEWLADAVLLVHAAVVLFVVLGLPAIVWGHPRDWAWAHAWGWRAVHLGAIAAVALQAWLGRYCPLTLWESALREQAGGSGYQTSFIQHWVSSWMYYDAPLWVFAVLYTAFGALVAWAWWRYPPRLPQ
jgi:hypothetical protein